MKVIILESNNNSYKVAIHFATPINDNTAGKSLKSCAIKSKLIGTTQLTTGIEPGDISIIEHDNIISGDVIEIIRTIEPGRNPTKNDIISLAKIKVDEYKSEMEQKLKYYGYMVEGK